VYEYRAQCEPSIKRNNLIYLIDSRCTRQVKHNANWDTGTSGIRSDRDAHDLLGNTVPYGPRTEMAPILRNISYRSRTVSRRFRNDWKSRQRMLYYYYYYYIIIVHRLLVVANTIFDTANSPLAYCHSHLLPRLLAKTNNKHAAIMYLYYVVCLLRISIAACIYVYAYSILYTVFLAVRSCRGVLTKYQIWGCQNNGGMGVG